MANIVFHSERCNIPIYELILALRFTVISLIPIYWGRGIQLYRYKLYSLSTFMHNNTGWIHNCRTTSSYPSLESRKMLPDVHFMVFGPILLPEIGLQAVLRIQTILHRIRIQDPVLKFPDPDPAWIDLLTKNFWIYFCYFISLDQSWYKIFTQRLYFTRI